MKLELRGITKRFGSLVANDHIDLTVEPGEIHCLLGENGAGKSTLMNVLYGLYQADEGEVLLDGEVQHFAGPGDAMAAGIGMVHQHFMLIPVFTVAENVMLGHEPTRAELLDLATARQRVEEISARFGFDIDPDTIVENLPVGAQQRVEIIKAIARDAEILVLDEPTNGLDPDGVRWLRSLLRQLAGQGRTVLVSSHLLSEVAQTVDDVVIIADGAIAVAGDRHALRAAHAGDVWELRQHDDLGWVADLAPVVSANDGAVHVHAPDPALRQRLVQEAASRGEVTSWRRVQPRLSEIFRETVA